MPLALHLLFASQAEAIQLFIRADVAEHGLHHRHAMAVDFFALLAIHPMLHLTGIGHPPNGGSAYTGVFWGNGGTAVIDLESGLLVRHFGRSECLRNVRIL